MSNLVQKIRNHLELLVVDQDLEQTSLLTQPKNDWPLALGMASQRMTEHSPSNDGLYSSELLPANKFVSYELSSSAGLSHDTGGSDLWPTLHKTRKPLAKNYYDDFAATFEGTLSATSYSCPTCEDDAAVDDTGGEVICTRCGTVVDIPLELGAEYRWFANDGGSGVGGAGDPSRCSFPVNHLMPESSLGTVINLRGGGSAVMRRLKRYHMWNLMPYRERTLWGVFEGLQVRASNAGVSTAIVEEAKELYAQLTATAICRGQEQRDAMLAACLWEALKRQGTARLPKDVAEMFNIPLRCVTKGIKQFQHLLAIRSSAQATDTYAAAGATKKIVVAEETSDVIRARARQRHAAAMATSVARTTSYEDFIMPFLTNLSVARDASAVLEKMVRHVCARVDDLGVVPENTPPSLTASVIAFCCTELKLGIDQAEIARVCSVSAVTIQKCLKRMGPWRDRLIAE
jgi:transcription initiation factor TFIIB